MRLFSSSFSVNLVGLCVGLSGYVFWAENDGNLYFFVLRVLSTITENWFIAFAILGGVLLHMFNLFFVFLVITACYILFMAWPDISPDQMLISVSNYRGEVTPGSVLLSPDAFRAYAMLIAIAFFDVLNLASARHD